MTHDFIKEILLGNVVQYAESDVLRVLSAFDDAVKVLARVIISTLFMYNPKHILLAGGMMRWPGYYENTMSVVSDYCLKVSHVPEFFEACCVKVSKTPIDLVMLGAMQRAKGSYTNVP